MPYAPCSMPHNPEIDLLLCCARTRITPDITEHIHSLVQQDIDWEFILKTSLHHRVMPLLYQSLKKTCPEEVPEAVLTRLQSYYLSNTKRNLRLTARLLEILNLFNDINVPAVPFKGPVLAKSIYGDIGLRQFSDLDILIHPNDALKARNVLMANNYQPELKLDDKQFCIYLKTKEAFTFICDKRNVFLDLHSGLKAGNSSFSIHPNIFNNHLKPVVIEGHKVKSLPVEEMLLYLCIHGALHCWTSLGGISCVAELVRSNPDLNYERLTRMVGKAKYERIFLLGLFLAQNFLGADPPQNIKNFLNQDPKIKSLATEVYRNLFHNNGTSTNNEISDKFSFFHIKVRERFSEKIRYIIQMWLYPTKVDWRRFPLPASMSFLLYLLRPIRLFLEFSEVLRIKVIGYFKSHNRYMIISISKMLNVKREKFW